MAGRGASSAAPHTGQAPDYTPENCPPDCQCSRTEPGRWADPTNTKGTPVETASAKKAEEEAEEEDEETYVAPTYAARCTGNKYEVISRWLLTKVLEGHRHSYVPTTM